MEQNILTAIKNINLAAIELLKIMEAPDHGDISMIKKEYFILSAVENSLWGKLRQLESC